MDIPNCMKTNLVTSKTYLKGLLITTTKLMQDNLSFYLGIDDLDVYHVY